MDDYIYKRQRVLVRLRNLVRTKTSRKFNRASFVSCRTGGQENVSLQRAEDCRMFICFRTIEEALERAGLKVMTNGARSELFCGRGLRVS